MARTLRVGLIFGNRTIREGRRMLLQTQPDFDIVYEESDGLAALEAIGDLSVDVLLVDNRLRSLSGSELVRRFLRRNVGTEEKLPGFVLTGPFSSIPMALEAIRCGASDMVSEEEEPETLLEAIRAAGSIEHNIDVLALTDFFADAGVPHGGNQRWLLRLTNLTDDEQTVLDLLAAGESLQGVEEKSGLPHTKVRWTLDGLQKRLGVATRAQLALALYEAAVLPEN
ncbi:MAG: hypothetical protein RJA35_772 [Actinomycetota bacterium]|jgi:DNA-binding NarL/FixJ family response regulator